VAVAGKGMRDKKKEKVDFTHCRVVIDGEIDTGWRVRGREGVLELRKTRERS
jgi:hypothetical protein